MKGINAKPINAVTKFIQQASPDRYICALGLPWNFNAHLDCRYGGRIPTGLVLAGPSIASHGALFQQMAAQVKTETAAVVVILRSTNANNLKTVLKNLIKDATGQTPQSNGASREDGHQDRV